MYPSEYQASSAGKDVATSVPSGLTADDGKGRLTSLGLPQDQEDELEMLRRTR